MKIIFDKVSYDVSKLITNSYSTSFSKGISLLDSSIQHKIYAIYGFVRLADEIVDSFEGYKQKELLNELETNYKNAINNRISLNPILNSFQEVVNTYLLYDLVEKFLESMRMDLYLKNYTNNELYEKYIHGSAEVVGLMCLKVFLEKDEAKYMELKPFAIKLGSAFQKVNFLRDIKDDFQRLGRVYFPNVNWKNFSEQEKNHIINEIQLEFNDALIGIKRLPNNCKLGVYVAYNYYKSLLKKLSNKSSEEILQKRTRIPDLFKICILQQSKIRLKFGIL